MSRPEQTSPFAAPALALAAAVSLALIWTTQSGDLLRPLLAGSPVATVPYLASVLINLSDVAVMATAIALAARLGPQCVFRLSGLTAPVRRPLLWALIVFVPVVLASALAAPLASGLTATDVFWKGAGFPVIEEVVYRGLAVAALMRLAGWSLWPACLWPALFFGLAHLAQGSGWAEVGGVVAITALGGLLFGWLFARWAFNLWPPILLHIGLNTVWMLFDLGDTAIGGWLGNALRLAAVVIAIGAALKMAPKRT